MIPSLPSRSSLLGASVVTLLALAHSGEAAAPTQVKPGFNVFSVQQDIEIGRQSSVEAERQLRLVRDRSVDDYLNQIVGTLAAGNTGPRFPYHAQAVNASEINAFALPGGPLYVNRGLIESARTEGELAGVIAHEMSHIALRHATHNVSKAYMAQAGLGILGGVLGGRSGAGTAQIINAVGGFGLNALFLKYNRDAETQADVMGAQMMARAGYDPLEMASFFDLLRDQARSDPGRFQQFFSDHPAPADRAARIRQEAQALGVSGVRTASIGGFEDVQARLRGQGAAPSMGRLDRRQARTDGQDNGGYGTYDDRGGYGDSQDRGGYGSNGGRPVNVRIDRPSSRFRTFQARTGFFEVEYPENWRAYESEGGLGVTLAPEGGVTQDRRGEQGIVYGVIINHYDPFGSSDGNSDGGYSDRGYSDRRDGYGSAGLEQATDDLVAQVMRTNSYLRRASRSPRREVIDGARALSLSLSGRSPLTGQDERVTVFTRELPEGDVLYSLLIAPSQDYGDLERTFDRMVHSLRVDDRAAHR
jgi:hypothetical protein